MTGREGQKGGISMLVYALLAIKSHLFAEAFRTRLYLLSHLVVSDSVSHAACSAGDDTYMKTPRPT